MLNLKALIAWNHNPEIISLNCFHFGCLNTTFTPQILLNLICPSLISSIVTIFINPPKTLPVAHRHFFHILLKVFTYIFQYKLHNYFSEIKLAINHNSIKMVSNKIMAQLYVMLFIQLSDLDTPQVVSDSRAILKFPLSFGFYFSLGWHGQKGEWVGNIRQNVTMGKK